MSLVSQSNEGKNKFSFLGALFHGATFYVFMGILIAGSIFAFQFYLQERDINVLISNSTNVRLGETVKLEFSTRMFQKSVENSIVIEPALKNKTVWESPSVLGIIPIEAPIPDTKYVITISDAKTQFYISQKEIKREFSSPVFPKIKTVYPLNGEKDVDIFEHITINFDKTIEEPFNVEVKIVPITSGFEHKFNKSRTQLVITPSSKMEKKTEYSLEIKIKHNNLDIQREVYAGKFTTKPPPPVFYSYGGQEKTEERLEEVEPQISEGKYIDIDLSSQTMFIFEDGKERGAFKVSTGKRGMDTPRGTFKVMGKHGRPWSDKYGLFMPWFIQFTSQGHGIHELPEWPSGYKEGTNHLGVPVSHGCVRLGVGPAKVVYDFATIGMLIVVHK